MQREPLREDDSGVPQELLRSLPLGSCSRLCGDSREIGTIPRPAAEEGALM